MIHATRAEVVAHRGASAYVPEHTFAAYDLALEQGADTLELDGRATRDGELVVLPDRTLLRTHGDSRRIDAVRYGELSPLTRPLRLRDRPVVRRPRAAEAARRGAARELRGGELELASARRLDALASFATGVGVLDRRVDARRPS